MNVRRCHVGKVPFVKTLLEHSNANVHPVLQETQQLNALEARYNNAAQTPIADQVKHV